jgi:hypothetical protein
LVNQEMTMKRAQFRRLAAATTAVLATVAATAAQAGQTVYIDSVSLYPNGFWAVNGTAWGPSETRGRFGNCGFPQ